MLQIAASLMIIILTTTGVNYVPKVVNYAPRVVNYPPRVLNYVPRVNNYVPRVIYSKTSFLVQIKFITED